MFQTTNQTALPMVQCILCNYQMHQIYFVTFTSILHGSNLDTDGPEL